MLYLMWCNYSLLNEPSVYVKLNFGEMVAEAVAVCRFWKV